MLAANKQTSVHGDIKMVNVFSYTQRFIEPDGGIIATAANNSLVRCQNYE
jgi:hypothetical protein